MAQARGTTGKNEDKTSKKLQNLNVKEEKKKKSSSSSSSSSNKTNPIYDKSAPTDLSDRGYSTTTSYTAKQVEENNKATKNAVQGMQMRSALMSSKAPSVNINANTLFGQDAQKIINNTNTAAIFNTVQAGFSTQQAAKRLPSTVLQTMANNAAQGLLNNSYSKEILKISKTTAQAQSEAYNSSLRAYFGSKFSNFNAEFPYYEAKYATAEEYTQMQREGYETVYIEEGSGEFRDKGGIFTIGRDHLSGVPANVKVLYIKRTDDGTPQLRYLADTSHRAELYDSLTTTQQAKCADLAAKVDAAFNMQSDIEEKLERVDRIVNRYESLLVQTRSEESFLKYQQALELRAKYAERWTQCEKDKRKYALQYAEVYDNYESAKNFEKGWSVEDEQNFQALSRQLAESQASTANTATNLRDRGYISSGYDTAEHSALLSAYLELYKRREEHKNDPVFINKDTAEYYNKLAESMGKAVDEFNKWDDLTIQMGSKDTIGTSFWQAMAQTFQYDVALKNTNYDDLSPVLTEQFEAGNAALHFIDSVKEAFVKTGKLFALTGSELNKAWNAYKAKEISEGAFRDEAKYIKNQFKGVLLNNVVANLDIFDLTSLQQEWAAYQMAKHPEYYKNDLKFKQLREAYKYIYGTDYRGEQDAARMAFAQLSVHAGDFHDYVYMDGSDIRHTSDGWIFWEEGEQYGTVASMLVGILTDVSTYVSLGQSASKTIAGAGSKELAKAITDSFRDALIRNKMTAEAAEALANSNLAQKAIKRATKNAIKDTINSGGDLLENIVRVQAKEFQSLRALSTVDFIKYMDGNASAKFLSDSIEALNRLAPDAISKSFLLNKSLTVSSVLHSVDSALDSMQRTLFKVTCPVAGAVVGISKSIKGIKWLVNSGKATKKTLQAGVLLGKELIASLSNVNFGKLAQTHGITDLINEMNTKFFVGALGCQTENLDEVLGVFRGFRDGMMRTSLNGTATFTVHTLEQILSSDGLEGLAKLADEYGYSSFDEMFQVIERNFNQEEVLAISTDVSAILKTFKNKYDDVILHEKLDGLKAYTDNFSSFISSMDDLSKEFSAATEKLNKSSDTVVVQGIALELHDRLKEFAKLVNPDYANVASSVPDKTVFELLTDAISDLEQISMGDPNALKTVHSVTSLEVCLENLHDIYLSKTKEALDNALCDAVGDTHYIDNINRTILPNHIENTAALDSVADGLVTMLKDNGVKISRDELKKRIFKDSSFMKNINSLEQISRVDRIIPDKGATAMWHSYNKANAEFISELVDSNSDFNKVLRLLREASDETTTFKINNAIKNACAVNSTRVFSDELLKSGVNSTVYLTLMDVWSGNSALINKIVQTDAPDVAASKLSEMLKREMRKQIALHNGDYSLHFDLGANTVDVAANVRNIENQLDTFMIKDETGAEKLAYEADSNYIDVVFSVNKITDGADPKDIAFHVRGSDDDPFVLRRDFSFDVHDDEFAKLHYGKSAEQARKEYAALGATGTVSRTEWQRQMQEYITQLKDQALAENKTLRFIGFNSSDAVTGGNQYMTRVFRSCGVSVNMANAIDFADTVRGNAGEFIFDSVDMESITRSIRYSIDDARVRTITLDVPTTVSYDPRNVCSEILSDALNNAGYPELLNKHAKYISDKCAKVSEDLGVEMYNAVGISSGTLIDAKALEELLLTAGIADTGVQKEFMKVLSGASDQLTTHKIIETKVIEQWFDADIVNQQLALAVNGGETAQRMFSVAQRLNQMRNDARRLDLLMELDTEELNAVYKNLLAELPASSQHTAIAAALSAKVPSLSVDELYVANRWLFEQVRSIHTAEQFSEIYAKLLANAPQVATCLDDDVYRFIRTSVVDNTDELLDPFKKKYLDTSEAGFRFCTNLQQLRFADNYAASLENYDLLVNSMFNASGIHGVQDRLFAMQSAAVYSPIISLYNEFKDAFRKEYDIVYTELMEPYARKLSDGVVETYTRDAKYVHKVATQYATDKFVASIREYGDALRADSVSAVLKLDADALRAHIIRNCGGGLIIDPSSQLMRGFNIGAILKKWEEYGLDIDTVTISSGNIHDRTVFRVSVKDLPIDRYGNTDYDAIFRKYNHANISFQNARTSRMNNGLRHSSFDASDMTLMDASHMQAFSDMFFKDKGVILDFSGRFNSWADELYSCNMWTDADLKTLVNPYYTDDALSNIAQNTHQVRKNISALHDLSSIMNNRFMNTDYILESAVRKSGMSRSEFVAESIKQIKEQNRRVCRIIADGNKFKVVDYTYKLSESTFDLITKNTIMLDEGMYNILADWNKATNIAIKMQRAPEFISNAYKIYKDTIRSATISMYLYGNIATGIRNLTDASIKAFNEVNQENEDMFSFLHNYVYAVRDAHEYSNVYLQIESELGTVDRETITRWFSEHGKTLEQRDKFNLLYGFEQTSGGDAIAAATAKQLRENATRYFVENAELDSELAGRVSRRIDSVYGSMKYRGMNSAQIQNHLTAIHDDCMKALKKEGLSSEQLEAISKSFYDYHPVVESWGDKITKFPVLAGNKAIFNSAEVRTRLALYETFIEGGATEAEAMAHVTATQFHYAGLGHVEDFFPFTQYQLYNAAYWFDHASSHAVKNMYRAAKYNGDAVLDAEEIADMCAKYRQRQYYLYDRGADEDYDKYAEEQLNIAGHILLDGVDSYLGLPRELQAGNLDLNGTHFIKLGNSFIEEVDLVVSCAVGAGMFSKGISFLSTQDAWHTNVRNAYEALKYTPLYDKFYNPWKAYIDFVVYAYDREQESGKPVDIWKYLNEYVANKDSHSIAIAGIPIAGAILSNLVGRAKAFDLNLGEIMALLCDPVARADTSKFIRDMVLDIAGMTIPSLIGTDVREDTVPYNYYAHLGSNFLIDNPTQYINFSARLQKLGFTSEATEHLMLAAFNADKNINKYITKQQYLLIAQDLFSQGFTEQEIANIFAQHHMKFDSKKFLAMCSALPDFLKYDKDKRNQVLAYYEAMGMSRTAAWAKLLNHPAVVENGKLIELSHYDVLRYNKQQAETYNALQKKDGTWWTDEDWDAFNKQLRDLGFYYPKGEQKRMRDYLRNAGYSFNEAQKLLLNGMMLNKDGVLVDVQGQARRQVFSYNSLQGAEWDAYWETVPDYTKYEKGAFGRTMKALKKMGYNDEQARAWIQMGIYVNPEGIMMNVTGMERPVLGYPSFNAYYQTLPDYIKYEKGAFKRTYAALKQLGFDYDTSLRLIQQGAYLMDATMAPHVFTTLGARRNRDGSDIKVTDINTLLMRYGGQLIQGADGKAYMLVSCAGLQRPRSTFSYSRRGSSGYGGYSGGYKKKKYERPARYSMYYTRKPFITQGNVSTFTGFTNYRGSNKLAKPYTTKGYVSTYSQQNFLNGSSYGMRKVYKVDMRQFKSGALSTKSAYPASYRNISVAYRRNLYKDMYAKYGASRMRMRSNVPGYSNASIVRLRRNEIQNRERYAERRDQVNKTKTQKKNR